MNLLPRALVARLAIAAASTALAAYPDRPITFIVPGGAGGGTDGTARYFATVMEKELGQPVNVVNRTGGSGVVGHSAIALAPQVVMFVGLTRATMGLDHVRPGGRRAPDEPQVGQPRFRILTRPMRLAFIVSWLALLGVLLSPDR